jgi:methyltransferase family protein
VVPHVPDGIGARRGDGLIRRMISRQVLRRRVERTPIPVELVQQIRRELVLWTVRARSRFHPAWRRRALAFRGQRGLLLNFGCGDRVLPGWVNVDGWSRGPVDLRCDLRRALPLDDGSCAVILVDHVLYALTVQSRPMVFREFHRLLAPGGTLRVVGTDCRKVVEAYAGNDEAFWQMIPSQPQGRGDGINWFFHSHACTFLDDFETLERSLREAGFREVVRRGHRESPVPELRIDCDAPDRVIANLCVEAVK